VLIVGHPTAAVIISPTTFYALVKEGELGIVKIGRRSFVLAEEIDEFLRRKRYDLPD
jgi:excisionase family DNA binding protein